MKEYFNLIFPLLTAATVTQCTSVKPKEEATKKPNVIYILADDMGYGDLSCLNPASKIQTPNLDKFASEGQTYWDAHSGSSVSTPSRYCVLTGRYAWRSNLKKGVLLGYSEPLIEKNRSTVAHLFHENGYNTLCIGKWHLGMTWAKKDNKKLDAFSGMNVDHTKAIQDTPVDRGFDYYYGISASLDMPPYALIENHNFVEQPDTLYPRDGYQRPGYGVKAEPATSILPSITRKAIEKINTLSKDTKPFFLYFALNAPHTPVAPTEAFKGKSQAGDYGDYVVEVDDVVRQVMASLKANKIDENTLVIITSDNGPEVICYERAKKFGHFSAGKLKGVKRDLWEGGHRVPFLVRWPGKVKPGTNVHQPICLIDFYATMAAVLHTSVPKEAAPDSYSFLPLMEGKNESTRPYIIHHSAHGLFAIRKGDWVYLDGVGDDNEHNRSSDSKSYYELRGYKYMNEPTSLYNLKDDEREFNDVKTEHPEIVKEMKAILEQAKK